MSSAPLSHAPWVKWVEPVIFFYTHEWSLYKKIKTLTADLTGNASLIISQHVSHHVTIICNHSPTCGDCFSELDSSCIHSTSVCQSLLMGKSSEYALPLDDFKKNGHFVNLDKIQITKIYFGLKIWGCGYDFNIKY